MYAVFLHPLTPAAFVATITVLIVALGYDHGPQRVEAGN
jgi:hypothetical protein